MIKKHHLKITSYLNAGHAIRWKDTTGKIHIHTWQIISMIGTLDTLTFPQYKFTTIEEVLNEVLEPFSQSTLNHIPPFDQLNPTIENFTDYLFDKFNEALKKLDCQLLSLEVSESPTRTCVITAL